MHITMYKRHYGNYSFTIEFDSGSEIGESELSLWYREKTDIHTIPLEQIPERLLLKALIEPYRTLLLSRLEALTTDIRNKVEEEIAKFQGPIQNTDHQQPASKMSRAAKKQTRRLRKAGKQKIKQSEHTFYRQELLTLERHCFNLELIASEYHHYGAWHYLRTFYFEEANADNIDTFCREFANLPDYREEILTGKRRWARRNALFVHNLSSALGKSSPFEESGNYIRQAREFFRWLDIHTDAILAHPDYQHLLVLDHTCQNKIITYQDPSSSVTDMPEQTPPIHDPERGIDPQLRLAVDIFQQLPGVTYLRSCQGISGKIHLSQYDIMAVTPHQEYAYITFGKLSYALHDFIIALLPQFPALTIQSGPYIFTKSCSLYAQSDNIQFRTEINALAMQVYAELLERTHGQDTQRQLYTALLEQAHKQNIQQTEIRSTTRWEEACYPQRYVPTQEPGGLLPSRCTWLCRTEQIEQTLYLLFHLNHWAKASDLLYYTDRQGLYSVKAVLIREAYQQGHLQAVGYIDGSSSFLRELDTELATDMAVELFADMDVTETQESMWSEWDKKARLLYQRVTGQAISAHPLSEQEREQLAAYMLTTLNELIKNAMQTRQPIAYEALADLLIMPGDLLHISWERARYINDWDDLDENDLRKLDPEGWSLIAFRYEQEKTRYTFHLPYRTAEQFIARECIEKLSSIARESSEYGVYYGRPMTDEESTSHPIAEILWELCVYTEGICPRKLERKDQRNYTSTMTWHPYEDDLDEDEDEDEEEMER